MLRTKTNYCLLANCEQNLEIISAQKHACCWADLIVMALMINHVIVISILNTIVELNELYMCQAILI